MNLGLWLQVIRVRRLTGALKTPGDRCEIVPAIAHNQEALAKQGPVIAQMAREKWMEDKPC